MYNIIILIIIIKNILINYSLLIYTTVKYSDYNECVVSIVIFYIYCNVENPISGNFTSLLQCFNVVSIEKRHYLYEAQKLLITVCGDNYLFLKRLCEVVVLFCSVVSKHCPLYCLCSGIMLSQKRKIEKTCLELNLTMFVFY